MTPVKIFMDSLVFASWGGEMTDLQVNDFFVELVEMELIGLA